MKAIPRFAQNLIVGAVALAVIGLATQAMAQQAATEVVAKVIRLTGHARYSSDNKSWKPIKLGDILTQGTIIQTAEKSSMDIMLGERETGGVVPVGGSGSSAAAATSALYSPEEVTANVVRITESSVLGIDKLTAQHTGADVVEETQLDLRAGKIIGNVKKMSAASKYEVKIPNGVAGIRGTTYIISSSGVVNVLAGSVVLAVVAPDGSVITKVISSWHRFDPSTGVLSPIPDSERGGLLHDVPPGPPGNHNPPFGPPHPPIIFISPGGHGHHP